MNFVLYKKVYQGDERCKKGTTENFPVEDGAWIGGAQGDAADCPG